MNIYWDFNIFCCTIVCYDIWNQFIVKLLSTMIWWFVKSFIKFCKGFIKLIKLVSTRTCSSARVRAAASTQRPRSLHAISTLPPCHLHAAVTPPPRRCTQPQSRLHAASTPPPPGPPPLGVVAGRVGCAVAGRVGRGCGGPGGGGPDGMLAGRVGGGWYKCSYSPKGCLYGWVRNALRKRVGWETWRKVVVVWRKVVMTWRKVVKCWRKKMQSWHWDTHAMYIIVIIVLIVIIVRGNLTLSLQKKQLLAPSGLSTGL